MESQTTTTEENTPADFVEDEERPGVAYIKPNLEMALSDVKKKECREIVREIKDFGVSQRQLLFLIDLLALELEDHGSTKRIREAIRGEREKMNVTESPELSASATTQEGLILPGTSDF